MKNTQDPGYHTPVSSKLNQPERLLSIKFPSKQETKHLWQPGDKSKDEHPTIMLPVGRQVGRVAQAVRSDGEDDDAQELGEKDHMELVRKIYRF